MQPVEVKSFVTELKDHRQKMDGVHRDSFKHVPNTRYLNLARTSHEAAKAWLGKVLGALGEAYPYPHSLDASTTLIEEPVDKAPDNLQALVFSQDDAAVVKIKHLRTYVASVIASLASRLQMLDPHQFPGKNGLTPYTALSQAIYQMHNTSMWLGYEMGDMLHDNRGGAKRASDVPVDKVQQIQDALRGVGTGDVELLTPKIVSLEESAGIAKDSLQRGFANLPLLNTDPETLDNSIERPSEAEWHNSPSTKNQESGLSATSPKETEYSPSFSDSEPTPTATENSSTASPSPSSASTSAPYPGATLSATSESATISATTTEAAPSAGSAPTGPSTTSGSNYSTEEARQMYHTFVEPEKPSEAEWQSLPRPGSAPGSSEKMSSVEPLAADQDDTTEPASADADFLTPTASTPTTTPAPSSTSAASPEPLASTESESFTAAPYSSTPAPATEPEKSSSTQNATTSTPSPQPSAFQHLTLGEPLPLVSDTSLPESTPSTENNLASPSSKSTRTARSKTSVHGDLQQQKAAAQAAPENSPLDSETTAVSTPSASVPKTSKKKSKAE